MDGLKYDKVAWAESSYKDSYAAVYAVYITAPG